MVQGQQWGSHVPGGRCLTHRGRTTCWRTCGSGCGTDTGTIRVVRWQIPWVPARARSEWRRTVAGPTAPGSIERGFGPAPDGAAGVYVAAGLTRAPSASIGAACGRAWRCSLAGVPEDYGVGRPLSKSQLGRGAGQFSPHGRCGAPLLGLANVSALRIPGRPRSSDPRKPASGGRDAREIAQDARLRVAPAEVGLDRFRARHEGLSPGESTGLAVGPAAPMAAPQPATAAVGR